MNKISSAITLLAMLVMAACNNSSDSATTAAATDTVKAAVVDSTPKAPEFKPFDVVEVSHAVKDYAKWRPLFNNDSVARKASGMELIVVSRELNKPNNLMITLQVSDTQKTKAFIADPRLKKVMAKGGVIGKPGIAWYHVIRMNPNSKEKQWVVITHKVKDFDAWLKVFDGEASARPSYGLVDVVLARGIEDPNTVQIVFDIKDMTKAKARMNDPALKKLMMDAGVEGAPKIVFYSQGD